MHRRYCHDADVNGGAPRREGEREVRAGAWSGWRPTHLIGKKASNKKVGIVGFGRIGQEFARRAHFGHRNLCPNRSQVAQDKLDQFNAPGADLETLFQTCDVISLHCPGGREPASDQCRHHGPFKTRPDPDQYRPW